MTAAVLGSHIPGSSSSSYRTTLEVGETHEERITWLLPRKVTLDSRAVGIPALVVNRWEKSGQSPRQRSMNKSAKGADGNGNAL